VKRIACAALLVALAPQASAMSVSAVAIDVRRDSTRLVFESSAAIRFNLFSLSNPERIVLDLEGVEPDAVLRELTVKVGNAHPYLKPPRVTRTASGAARIEMDLKGEAEPQIFATKPAAGRPASLVLEIHPMPGTANIDLLAPPQVAPLPPVAAQPPAAVAALAGETWLAVRLNRQGPLEDTLLNRRADGRLMVRRADLERWRMRLPDQAPVVNGEDAWYPLDALRGLSYQMDEPGQILNIEAPPGLFNATQFRGTTAGSATPTPADPGGFANYDVSLERSDGRTSAGGVLEVGAFNRHGAAASTFLARNVDGLKITRLDTTLTQDRPAQLASLRVGDALGAAGGWGRPMRFGGVQWATNFATQPEYVTFPMPGLAGEASLPSTVDLYVNDALRLTRNVPTGPFSIQDLPVITGQGEARLVVRDALGRERVITQPFYATPRLLKRGLQEFSYEAGFIRNNYGLASNDYGRAAAVATHRIGLSDRLTAEARGEMLRDQQTAGVGGAVLLPSAGVFTASMAASRSARGSGALFGFALEHSGRWFNFGADYQAASERFVQLGMEPGERASRDRMHAFVSLAGGAPGSLGLNYTRQRNRDRADVELVGASYALTLGKLGFLSVSAVHVRGEHGGTTVGVNFTRPLDGATTASAGATLKPGQDDAHVALQRNLPPGTGLGYQLTAAEGAARQLRGSLLAQNDVGIYSLEASRNPGQSAVRMQAQGGVGWLAGLPFASRPVQDSFAVAQVDGFPDVRIYAENQVVARTDANGRALIPRLRPYQRNAIRVEQADLPMDAQVDAVQVDAVPYFRSGVVLRFPVKHSRGATLTLVLDDGKPMPAGAVATIAGRAEEFPVGLQGRLYLADLESDNRVRITWRGQHCELAVQFAQTLEPLPDLGTRQCAGVKP
jgi:outer membrane usher protein